MIFKYYVPSANSDLLKSNIISQGSRVWNSLKTELINKKIHTTFISIFQRTLTDNK